MSTQTTPLFMLMHKGERKPKKHLGVLEIKPCQGRGLRVVQKIGKQDPYVSVEYGIRSQRTKADKNGGQKPRWEDIFKFDIFEGDTEVRVQCLDQNLRDSSLIGQRAIDFSPVLKSYQWDGWFDLRFQGTPAGDIYFEFTYYPEGGIPKPSNPPKPSVHRISLTPKEILCQMKEAEDALPPLDSPSQNTESQPETNKASPQKVIPPSPIPAAPSVTSRAEADAQQPHFSGTLHSKLEHAYSFSGLPLHEKRPHHPRLDHMRSFIHRNSEPMIYPNGHFYTPPEVNLPAEKVMSNSPERIASNVENERPSSNSSLEATEDRPRFQSVADRRKSKLIGPRRANSTPEIHNSSMPRTENISPSKMQPRFEYFPSPQEHRYSVPYLPQSPHFQGYSSPSWGFAHIPSSPFPPPPPGTEYPASPAFMMSPHMYSEPAFFDENYFPYSGDAVPPTDCR